jgi:hypothetical protein
MKVGAVLLASSLAGSAASAAEDYSGTYLCQGKAAAGVRFRADTGWTATEFTPINLLVKIEFQSQEGELVSYAVTIGSPGEEARKCEEVESGGNVRAHKSFSGFRCRAYPEDFRFDFQSKRFIKIRYIGYTDGNDDPNAVSPLIEVGECGKV